MGAQLRRRGRRPRGGLQRLQTGPGSDQIADLLRDKIAVLDARLQQMTELRNMLQTRLRNACPLQLGSSGGASDIRAATPGSR